MTLWKAQDMVSKLMTHTSEVRYGTVSVTVKLHDGRIVAVTYSTTSQTREPKDDNTINQ